MNPILILQQAIEEEQLWKETKTFSRNQFIKVAGSADSNLYFIAEGAVRVYLLEEDEELTIRFGYQNDFITALDAFITGKASELYIQALKKTTVKVISKEVYQNFIQSDKKYIQLWYVLLEQLVVQQLERERDLLTSSPQVRYDRVVNRSPKLFQEIPLKYIASYLRMTPETLSRIRAK